MEQEIFKSLNCPRCEHPYSKTADGDHVPTQTFCLDIQAMCMKCYRTCQDNKSVRKHQCNGINCLGYKTLPAYYLMEFLSNDCFVLKQEKNGYVMVSQSIQTPECPICHEEYSIENSKREPFALHCGHSLCNGCFDQMKSGTISGPSGDWPHVLRCPKCQDFCPYAQTSWENPLKAFLRELPTKQMELAEKEAQSKQTVLNRNCDDCGEESPLIKMFRCNDCGDKTFCGSCVVRKHRLHRIVDLSMRNLKEEILSTITPQITAYDVCFSQLQNDLIKNIGLFQKRLFNGVDQIETLHFDQATEQSKDSLVIGEKFEELSEKYLKELRSCNTGIEKLIDEMSGKKASESAGNQMR